HRGAGETVLFGKPAARRHPGSGGERAGEDRVADALVHLPIERFGEFRIERDMQEGCGASHRAAILSAVLRSNSSNAASWRHSRAAFEFPARKMAQVAEGVPEPGALPEHAGTRAPPRLSCQMLVPGRNAYVRLA